jgi:hypothetical protein
MCCYNSDRGQSHEAILGENNQTIALLEFFDPTGQIFDPRQQLLVHRPRDEGQNARPIH